MLSQTLRLKAKNADRNLSLLSQGKANDRIIKSQLFEGMLHAALSQILALAKMRHIEPRQNVIVKGERANSLFVLQRGRARSYIVTKSGTEILLLWVAPGAVLGLVSLLADPPPYLVNTTTVSECDLLEWDHGTARKLATAYPKLSENGFRLALEYLDLYMKRHAKVVTESAESRLAHKVHQLAKETGVIDPSGIAIDITNEQLSSLSDISPFTTSRLLSKWEREGKLSKQRGRVTLLAPESLVHNHHVLGARR